MNIGFEINETEFTDRVDVNEEISLFEYGVLRNPKTNETILGVIGDGEKYTHFQSIELSLDEIKEIIEQAPKAFFDFTGTDKEDTLNSLDNEHLACNILDLKNYQGVEVFGIDTYLIGV